MTEPPPPNELDPIAEGPGDPVITPLDLPEVRDVVAGITAGGTPMRRDDLLRVLRAHKPLFMERFDVARLTLFGSVARDEAEADSDLDLLVRFNGPSMPRNYFGLTFYLEDLLGREIDLVIEKALRREFRPYVESEAIVV